MRKVLFFLLSSLLCWQLSALDGPKNQIVKPPTYLSLFMPLYDSTAFPVCIANVKARLKDTLVCVNVVAVNFDTIAAVALMKIFLLINVGIEYGFLILTAVIPRVERWWYLE